ncbi:MAG TPA: CoA pyrophosphatase [Ramlibacter sp.]|jgi:8-oxo-dGTP pyrophosphatase MutT (NUDIX family)|uniref:NUDIX hydrolase n=1 Tax=Ramlibacter sp. TaxID=1917967 RepID=UPI002D6C5E94|nr:CoA pyrophosphatase [Ramlibacter sp.]HZY19044.1 CoA pyrophosphatase [Ramlibacter sp.]
MLLDASLRETVVRNLAAFQVHRADTGQHRPAAVAVALVEEGPGAALAGIAAPVGWSREAALLLTRRAATLSNHAGQWALPGGRVDEGESAEAAALRELAEEVALEIDPSQVLGRLDDYVTRSGFVITPVVVWAGAARAPVPHPAEVASIHRIPVREFMRQDAPLLEPSEEPSRQILRMPVGDGWIAAPTAAVLYQFREVCIAGRDTRVGHYDQPLFARR